MYPRCRFGSLAVFIPASQSRMQKARRFAGARGSPVANGSPVIGSPADYWVALHNRGSGYAPPTE